MEKNIGIWMDGTKALLVDAASGNLQTIEADIENSVHLYGEGDKGNFTGGGHHINNERKFDERRKHQTNDYLKRIAEGVKDADHLYVFGPAEMKTHFKNYIESQHGLKNKLSAVESADKMTDNQVVAAVKTFFEKKRSN